MGKYTRPKRRGQEKNADSPSISRGSPRGRASRFLGQKFCQQNRPRPNVPSAVDASLVMAIFSRRQPLRERPLFSLPPTREPKPLPRPGPSRSCSPWWAGFSACRIPWRTTRRPSRQTRYGISVVPPSPYKWGRNAACCHRQRVYTILQKPDDIPRNDIHK